MTHPAPLPFTTWLPAHSTCQASVSAPSTDAEFYWPLPVSLARRPLPLFRLFFLRPPKLRENSLRHYWQLALGVDWLPSLSHRIVLPSIGPCGRQSHCGRKRVRSSPGCTVAEGRRRRGLHLYFFVSNPLNSLLSPFSHVCIGAPPGGQPLVIPAAAVIAVSVDGEGLGWRRREEEEADTGRMKRRNADCSKLRRPLKRNRITDGIYGR